MKLPTACRPPHGSRQPRTAGARCAVNLPSAPNALRASPLPTRPSHAGDAASARGAGSGWKNPWNQGLPRACAGTGRRSYHWHLPRAQWNSAPRKRGTGPARAAGGRTGKVWDQISPCPGSQLQASPSFTSPFNQLAPARCSATGEPGGQGGGCSGTHTAVTDTCGGAQAAGCRPSPHASTEGFARLRAGRAPPPGHRELT